MPSIAFPIASSLFEVAVGGFVLFGTAHMVSSALSNGDPIWWFVTVFSGLCGLLFIATAISTCVMAYKRNKNLEVCTPLKNFSIWGFISACIGCLLLVSFLFLYR